MGATGFGQTEYDAGEPDEAEDVDGEFVIARRRCRPSGRRQRQFRQRPAGAVEGE